MRSGRLLPVAALLASHVIASRPIPILRDTAGQARRLLGKKKRGEDLVGGQAVKIPDREQVYLALALQQKQSGQARPIQQMRLDVPALCNGS